MQASTTGGATARDPRLRQIASIANAEPIGSPLYLTHVGLLLVGGVTGAVLFGVWWLAIIISVYAAVLTLEKRTAARAVEADEPARYFRVMALLFTRAVCYNVLVVAVWSVDGDVFKLAAMALLVAATINIFVFHATYPEVIACVVGPVWLGFAAIAALCFVQFGLAAESFAASMIFVLITPYFYMALMNAHDQWAKVDVIQQALTQAQKQDALGKLVAGVAHDFNNILAVTLGNAELLRDAQGPDKQELADEITKAAERGASLSRQLLAFGRRARLEPTRNRVRDILDNLQQMLGRVLPDNIIVNATAHSGTPAVFVDRSQLETALLNLAINARDAMPEGGRLDVVADAMEVSADHVFSTSDVLEPGLYTRIRVVDTGIGASKEVQREVFDPFFTTKPVGKGSGLGLSMVSGFARQSGGAVQFQSEVGKGTTVSLILPAATVADEHPGQREAEQPLAEAVHVLLVDDDESVRRVLERQLRSRGHHVTVAVDGQDAEAKLRAGLRPSLLLTDLVMPGPVQGLHLASLARDLVSDLPVLFMSGFSQDAQEDIAAWSASAQVLQKPVPRADLLKAVEATLVKSLDTVP